MSERLEARAEITKLARLLAAEPSELTFLEALPAAALREYREAATERLFEADAAMFHRVGAATKLLPSGLVATIAQRGFGPLLCARAAGCVDTAKALDVLGRLEPEFVAEATMQVDPRRVADLIGAVSSEVVVPVAKLLGGRHEYVTMGRFLAYVPDHAITGAIGALSDEALLRTAFVLEHKERLDHAVGLLPDDRLPGVIATAAELDLWPEALDLLDHLSDERRGPIADVVSRQDEEVVAGLVDAVAAAGIWDSLLPVVRLMSEENRMRLARMAPFHDPAIMRAIIEAAADQSLWLDLVPLIDALPVEVLTEVGRIAAALSTERLTRIIADAAATPQTLPTLLAFASNIDEEVSVPVLATVADALASLPPDRLEPLLAAAAASPGVLEALVAFAEQMPEAGQDHVAAAIRRAPPSTVRELAHRLQAPPEEDLLDRLPPTIRTALQTQSG